MQVWLVRSTGRPPTAVASAADDLERRSLFEPARANKEMPIGMSDLVRAGHGYASGEEAIGAVSSSPNERAALTPLPDENDNDLRYFSINEVEFGICLGQVKHYAEEIRTFGRLPEDDVLGKTAFFGTFTGGDPVTPAISR